MSKFCNHCGASVDEEDRFCTVCGKPITAGDGAEQSKASHAESQKKEEPHLDTEPITVGGYLIMFLMRARLDIGYYLLHIILPEAVYTIVVAFIFYPLLLLLHKWLWCADRGSTE